MAHPTRQALAEAQAEIERLRAVELELTRALELADMGTWDWDILTDKITWSDRVHDLFGIPKGEFDGSFAKFTSPIPPEDLPILESAIEHALKEDILFVVEHRVRLPDGRIRWVRGQGRTVRDEDGRPIRMAGVSQDVTERIAEKEALSKAVGQAQEANRLKNAILANMSHEIRTPMTAILGYTDILAHKLAGTPEQRFADIVRDGGRRLLHLLDSIVDLARIEADRMTLDLQPHRLADTVAHSVEMLQVLAERKGLRLEVDADPDVWVVSDPRREEQVLNNIISNAIRFSESGTIRISARRSATGDTAELAVTDTGLGIEPEFLPHVFEEFRQESEGFQRRHEGSGLGLSIAKKLIEKMSGTIELSSQMGVGTTVVLRIPSAAAGPIEREPAAAPLPALRPSRLLVIEDEAAIGVLIGELLPTHQVVWRESAEEAFALLERGERFDTCLMDVHLKPGHIDGLSAMRRLRDNQATISMPVIALTAYAMKGDRERFLREGFNDYLAKPFALDELERVLSRALGTRQP